MGFRLFRADAVFSAPLVTPALDLISGVPEILRAVYQSFAIRYPFVGTNAFRAVASNNLSEVGLALNLLDNRLEITFQVSQFSARAANLHTSAEIRFAQDCVILMLNTINHRIPGTKLSDVTLRLMTWLVIDGDVDTVENILKRVSRPAGSFINLKAMGADQVKYRSKVELTSKTGGWRFVLTAEPSIVPGSNLYLQREYNFNQAGTMKTLEKQIAFVETSSATVIEWLGIGPLEE